MHRLYLFIYLSPSTRVHVVPFTGGLLLLPKATGAAREPTPRPVTTVGEPVPRTGRRRELNPGPLDLQTNALPTELTGRLLNKCLASLVLCLTRRPCFHRSCRTGSTWRWCWTGCFSGSSWRRVCWAPSPSSSRRPRCTTSASRSTPSSPASRCSPATPSISADTGETILADTGVCCDPGEAL